MCDQKLIKTSLIYHTEPKMDMLRRNAKLFPFEVWQCIRTSCSLLGQCLSSLAVLLLLVGCPELHPVFKKTCHMSQREQVGKKTISI